MADSECFIIPDAPCLSDDDLVCARDNSVATVSSALIIVDYICPDAIDFDVEFEIRPNSGDESEFPTTTVTSDIQSANGPGTFAVSAGVGGLLRAGVHVDIVARVRVDGQPTGAEQIHQNIEIVP